VNREVLYGRWEQLQEPPRTAGQRGPLLRLLSALDVGWEIEGPVLTCPQRGNASTRLYQFNLVNTDSRHRRTLSLLATQGVQLYLEDERVQVL
jgi:hypothetical protein